ncbi:MAG: recombinase family protein [Stutzerimonas stutzeri]|uniref:recombinase family protein n=1 Tax=Stutzerimonas stutzeri TaxID=316 RepID=UPI0018D8FD46|nr:recombinase family protein [Stutzerimonas stutzeri]MBH3353419.1 recombinase family protein [Stutzerimonas stutzeri]
MSRTFAYCRVSTTGQTTANQIQEIKAAGFAIQSQRVIEETVSGSVPAKDRQGFQKLLERIEEGDVLVVTKLDRLGRNAIDVRSTVEFLAAKGVRVHCLALGGVDLTSPAGKMTMAVIASVAEFERDLLVERTQAGLERAKSEGKRLGRPSSNKGEDVAQLKSEGLSQSAVAKRLNISLSTVKRLWNTTTETVQV